MPKPKIAIVYYSMYGHVRTLALAEKEGLESAGCEGTLLKVPETLSDEVLGKMGAPGVGKDDEEASAARLADYDGFLFGLSARFGMASAQVKALLDSTGGLWQKVCAGVEEAYACRVGSMAWTGPYPHRARSSASPRASSSPRAPRTAARRRRRSPS